MECLADDCVCSVTTIHREKPLGTEMTVVLVDEPIGLVTGAEIAFPAVSSASALSRSFVFTSCALYGLSTPRPV